MSPPPFSLNLRHLRALPVIVARRSMGAAAAAVSLSQPALTQGLAKMERQLGLPLFDRHRDGMIATPAGLIVAARADEMFDRLAQATRGLARGIGRPERLMTATQLRAFLSIADAGGYAPAARATGLSEPAIHRGVRELEQVVGLALVERRGRGIMLTDAGRRLARGVRLAAGEIAAAVAEVTPGDSGSLRITIGAMPLCRAVLLPGAVARLLRDDRPLDLDIVEGSWRELVEPLRDGAIDLMIGALRDDPLPDLDQRPLVEDRPVVVARAGHPLVGTGPAPADLARYPWIIARAGAPLRAHWETMFAGGPRPATPVECGSVMTIRGILADSDCLTLLSPDQVAVEVAGGMLVHLGPPLDAGRRTIGLTTRAGWRPTAAHGLMIAALEDSARAIVLQQNQSTTGLSDGA